MKKIAIIPARRGSKRIPNKNIKLFYGKPIIAYSIESACKSGLYDEVMVSTDCETISNIAKKYGAKVPFIRSAKNSDDFATTSDVLLEVLNYYKKREIIFDYATCIYACSPFVSVKLLVDSMDIIMAKKCDCVFPVLAYNHPIQRALSLIENSYVVPFDDSKSNVRTQDLNKAYHDAGMYYTIDIKKFFVNKNLRTKNTIGIEIDELKAHDIDSENDWILAEMKYKLFFK
tara:strand:- start:420 stop:1109 length:690 start_codon:yes stop_codon:yes gene_type:complete